MIFQHINLLVLVYQQFMKCDLFRSHRDDNEMDQWCLKVSDFDSTLKVCHVICPVWIVKRLGRLNLIYWLKTKKYFTSPVTFMLEIILVKNKLHTFMSYNWACLLQIIFHFHFCSWLLMVLVVVLHACNTHKVCQSWSLYVFLWIVKRLGRLNLICRLETKKCIFTSPVSCMLEIFGWKTIACLPVFL